MTKKYYKVVTKIRDCLYSCRIHETGWKTTYQIGRFVTPKKHNTKLMVFETIEQARFFIFKANAEQIYKCEVINPTKNAPFISMALGPMGDIENEIWELWKQKKKWKHLMSRDYMDNIIMPPEGTVFASEVKLIKKVA